jgi:hypothetical protein
MIELNFQVIQADGNTKEKCLIFETKDLISLEFIQKKLNVGSEEKLQFYSDKEWRNVTDDVLCKLNSNPSLTASYTSRNFYITYSC